MYIRQGIRTQNTQRTPTNQQQNDNPTKMGKTRRVTLQKMHKWENKHMKRCRHC